jgi:hypothetical protein
MRKIAIGVLCVSALALSACVPRVTYSGFEASKSGSRPLRSLAALDCPDQQGELTRTDRSPDGKRCDYVSAGGDAVSLKLVALDGRAPAEVMAPTKAELMALVPVDARPVPAVDKDEPGEHTNVDLPFIHIHTRGDHADVKFFGIKVHSDGDYAEVHSNLGLKHTVVHAGPKGAEVVAEDIGKTNVDMLYVLASEKRRHGPYAAVGYIAKGPVAGPLVVAEFRAREDHDGDWGERGDRSRHHHDRHDDVSRLVERNVRG